MEGDVEGGVGGYIGHSSCLLSLDRQLNHAELTGLEFGKSQRAVENRDKWRKLVAKSSVVPQRPSRLRD